MSQCMVAGCANPVRHRGVCTKHYSFLRRYGLTELLRITPDWRPRRRGTNHPMWSGDEAGYHAVHARLRKERGKAREHLCACGKQAKHWAYKHGSGNGLKYSLDMNDYEPMCVSCHRKLDQNRRSGQPINGGTWSPPLGMIDRPLDERIVDALVAGDGATARALYIEETKLLGEEQQ